MTDIIAMIGAPVASFLAGFGITGMFLLLVTGAMLYWAYKKKPIPILFKKYKRDMQWAVTIVLACGVIYSGALSAINTNFMSVGGAQQTGGLGNSYGPTSVTITVSPRDADNSATAVGGTTYVKRQGSSTWETGVTTVSPGEIVDVWVSNRTTYDCPIMTGVQITTVSGVQTIYPQCSKNASKSITAYDTTNHVALTCGGSATNVTVGAGGSVDVDFGIQGQGEASTGAMTIVFELSNKTTQDAAKTQVTENGVALSASVGCPAWYTPASTNAACVVVNTGAVTSTATKILHINVPATSASYDMSQDNIKMSPYSNNAMIDSSGGALKGQVYVGVADSANTVQSISYLKTCTIYLDE